MSNFSSSIISVTSKILLVSFGSLEILEWSALICSDESIFGAFAWVTAGSSVESTFSNRSWTQTWLSTSSPVKVLLISPSLARIMLLRLWRVFCVAVKYPLSWLVIVSPLSLVNSWGTL